MTPYALRAIFLILFLLSGFAGLIYESIWSHYLKLFLGHAAYAQTLVLSIFMGGMALGSWFSSRTSRRWPNLLMAYALIEGIIGLLGIVFHGIFVRTLDFAFNVGLPAVESSLLATLIKWSLGTILILPQSVLLGMTFPLMSAGLIRRFPGAPGSTLAMLYFTNSAGATIGVLVSGFLLIDAVGLPGTILTAGLINVALAITVWALLKKQPPETRPEASQPAPALSPSHFGYRLMLVIALITGLSSFIYEIGWIRMLSLVLGSSTHSFELMLSAFLLGLALGGLWIRKRIDAAASPERFLAIVQILMGAFALASLPLYNYTFDAMLWLLQSVQRNNGGYLLFNLTSHVIAMVVMLPTTFCAGMTLPLITYALLRQGHGERSIGAVYGANTAGAIAGIFLAVHLAMPILGLTGLITLGAALDILLGLVLIWRAHRTKSTPSRRVALTWTTAGVLAITATSLFAGIDPLKRASGVYRTGALLEPSSGTEVVYHRDGKTASVDVLHVTPPSTLSIRTNGKTDASVQIDGKGASLDEPTMILAAALPMLYHPRAQSVAVIGMGSGLTSNTFLRNPSVARVDTIEIEQAMVAGARKFLPRNELVYTDPRSRVHIEDAKTFFSTHKSQYDIIASEPSNPWVSGVSSLFTDEFYGQVRRHLNDDGLLVQWIQVYEIDTRLVMTVLKALSRNFSDYAIYTSGHTDTIIVAKKNGALGSLDFERHVALGLGNDLGHIEVRNTYDVWLRKVGSRRFLQPLVESWPIPYNSDYFPILDQNAVRTRFLDQRAYELVELPNAQLPLLEMLGGEQPPRDHVSVSPTSAVLRTNSAAQALALLNYVANGSLGSTPAQLNVQLARNADYLRFAAGSCSYLSRSTHWEEIMFAQSALVNTYLSRSNAVRFWSVSGFDRCRPHMTDQQRKWYSLHKAVAARDAVSMARLAREMLADSTPRGDARGSYLLSAGMLGYLASGAKPEARALWNEYSARVLGDRTPDLSLRLLVAHTLAQS